MPVTFCCPCGTKDVNCVAPTSNLTIVAGSHQNLKCPLKARSHCSDNENAIDKHEENTFYWLSCLALNMRKLIQPIKASIVNVLVFVLIIEACVDGPKNGKSYEVAFHDVSGKSRQYNKKF